MIFQHTQNSAASHPRFEIGLVMAGAISAGAYTAGVIDFLIEALDQWYAAHGGNPPHDVKLRVMSGASAGGMAGSILISALGGDKLAPVRSRPAKGVKSENELYRAWVQEIDIEHMLEDRDLAENEVLSALDSTKLREIAEHAVEVEPAPEPIFARRPYLADPFELVLSVANLRGVPYKLKLKGGSETMTLHADQMHFAIGSQPAGQAVMLDTADYNAAGWKQLSKAALATGAFPFGLAPRTLSRPSDYYENLEWPFTHVENGTEFKKYQKLTPEWSEDQDDIYEFLCVDGGLLNNEPFEHAHRALKRPAGRNERAGNMSDRAVILIAPFPSQQADSYEAPDGPVSFASALFSSLMEQVRFKPEELILALNDNIYSRFLISPKRRKPPKGANIAGATLGGFGGFIHEEFRHHDFMLGRRNCQQFLKDRLILPCGTSKSDPERNRLFDKWPDGPRGEQAKRPDGDTVLHLPIIPLVGTAAQECPRPDWPGYPTAKLKELSSRIRKRTSRVGNALISANFQNFIVRNLLKLALNSTLWLGSRVISNRIKTFISKDLKEHGVKLAK